MYTEQRECSRVYVQNREKVGNEFRTDVHAQSVPENMQDRERECSRVYKYTYIEEIFFS